jgi:hypothetical protein
LNIVPINIIHVLYMLLFSFTQIFIMEIFKIILKRKMVFSFPLVKNLKLTILRRFNT